MVRFVHIITLIYKVTSGSVTLSSDSDNALSKIRSQYPNPDKTDYDLVKAIVNLMSITKIKWVFKEVKGHQDDHVRWEDISVWEKENVRMDKLSKSMHNIGRSPNFTQQLFGCPWIVTAPGCELSGNITERLREAIQGGYILAHWQRNHHITQKQTSKINWESLGDANKKATQTKSTWITKLLSGQMGIGKNLKHWVFESNDKCPGCGSKE